MTMWLAGVIGLLLAGLVCAGIILRARSLSDCLVALQMAGLVFTLALLSLAQGMSRPSFFDLALAVALLSFPAALLFAHCVERWLR